ncbi:Hypothetical protein A7982_03942 [Minicystis rosea]|nr:Hypothetical protein A7982_03942 [Minicystis rosea]
MKTWILAPIALVAASGCGNDFDPQSQVESVRILATRADKPYAKPGDTVSFDILAYDGRRSPASPMSVVWVKAVCANPPGDSYYACYPAFANQFQRGVDLTPVLHEGTTFSLEVPADALEGHPATAGTPAYGTLIVFSMACAGHVEYLGQSATSPQAIPFGCFDAGHAKLGPDDFVFAFSRLFVFDERVNANPVIEQLTFDGAPVDPSLGITMDHCATTDARKCPEKPVDISVPASSQELDPGAIDPQGKTNKEQIWVDYYVTTGSVKDDLRLLYDPATGRVSSSANALTAPEAPAEGVLFAVVHDNRGGINWLQVPLHIQ